jgi:hypothetical protein
MDELVGRALGERMEEDILSLLMSSIRRVSAVTWGDYNKDGKNKSILKINKNVP